MKFVQTGKMIIAILLALIVIISISPLVVSAESDWGSDQFIEDNAGYSAERPQVAISGSNVVAVWYQYDGSNDRIYSNYSSDGGVSWGSDQLIENNTGHEGDSPQVAISGLNVVAVWYQNDGSNSRIYSNYSSDGGATWGSDQLIEDNTGHDAYSPQVAISGSNVVAVWKQHDGSRTRIYSNYSSNGGISWGSDQLIEDNTGISASLPQVAMSGSNVVAVWVQGSAIYRVYSNYSSNGGVSWGSDQMIENNGYEGESPQVEILGSNVVAVWAQKDSSNNNRIYSNYSSNGGISWGSDQLIEDNVGHIANSPQVAISGSNIVAVWSQLDESDDPRVYSNYSSNSGVSWGSDQLIEDNTGDHAYSPQVAMSGSNVVAVWSQNIGQIRVHSNYSSDSGVSWGSDQLIEDNTTYSGYYPQVAMSGIDAIAVWKQGDGSNNRIYSNRRDINPSIPLVAGWNLVSLPLIPTSNNITDIINTSNLLSGNPANIVYVYCYNITDATWMWWNGTPAGNLHILEDGLGYWVYATVADTLTVHGTEAGHPGPDYPVLSGWNLIGFSSTSDMAPDTYLTSVDGNYTWLYRRTTGDWLWWSKNTPASTFTNMEPGYGYWLYMTTGGTITPP